MLDVVPTGLSGSVRISHGDKLEGTGPTYFPYLSDISIPIGQDSISY